MENVLECDPPSTSSVKLEKENSSSVSIEGNANAENITDVANPDTKSKEGTEVAGLSSKCIIEVDLTQISPSTDKAKPMFLNKNWRESLCACERCSDFYAKKGIGFITDKEDSIADYEGMAKQKRNENLQKQEGAELDFLNNLNHVTKMEILSGIADMKNEFSTFLVCEFTINIKCHTHCILKLIYFGICTSGIHGPNEAHHSCRHSAGFRKPCQEEKTHTVSYVMLLSKHILV